MSDPASPGASCRTRSSSIPGEGRRADRRSGPRGRRRGRDRPAELRRGARARALGRTDVLLTLVVDGVGDCILGCRIAAPQAGGAHPRDGPGSRAGCVLHGRPQAESRAPDVRRGRDQRSRGVHRRPMDSERAETRPRSRRCRVRRHSPTRRPAEVAGSTLSMRQPRAYMITATPATQSAAPVRSKRSGRKPSNSTPHSREPTTKTPP